MTERRTPTKSKSKPVEPVDRIVITEIIGEIALSESAGDPPMAAVGRVLDPIIGGLNDGEFREFKCSVLGVEVEISAHAPISLDR